jgi:hypothetical protein
VEAPALLFTAKALSLTATYAQVGPFGLVLGFWQSVCLRSFSTLSFVDVVPSLKFPLCDSSVVTVSSVKNLSLFLFGSSTCTVVVVV